MAISSTARYRICFSGSFYASVEPSLRDFRVLASRVRKQEHVDASKILRFNVNWTAALSDSQIGYGRNCSRLACKLKRSLLTVETNSFPRSRNGSGPWGRMLSSCRANPTQNEAKDEYGLEKLELPVLRKDSGEAVARDNEGSCVVTGGVVALGKFDALHIGHRALAEQASKMGRAFLLSFSGMAEVLGWEKRLSVVAECDRRRIMSVWAENCGGYIPNECSLEFVKVRSLSPRDFVRKLAKEICVHGVVAGANYRFGYKAAGDASDLVHFCNEFGLQAFIVDPVMDKFQEYATLNDDLSTGSREKGQVSSTRVRKALASGDMQLVSKLLGRKHRLIVTLDNQRWEKNILMVSIQNALNQPPRQGSYNCTLGTAGLATEEENSDLAKTYEIDNTFIWYGRVDIGVTGISVVFADANFDATAFSRRHLGIEFL